MKSLKVVVGAQYGSEAKGHVTARILDHTHEMDAKFDVPRPQVNVRVAGPNAGHTAYDKRGNKFALRSVPVGATRDYPMTLVIAPGSEVDLDVLLKEWEELTDAGLTYNKSLYVDPSATLIEAAHKEQERGLSLTSRIGSTGKGIGAARASRLMRSAKRLIDSTETVKAIKGMNGAVHFEPYRYGLNDQVVIEGTQGYGLGLHGLHYPQCTSSDCRAIDFCAMAGINPWEATYFQVWAVARMYPIRVAGNSGPMYGETTWEELGLEPEQTTVTLKTRRVGAWDPQLVRDAVMANGVDYTRIALTMVDQKWPEMGGVSTWRDALDVMKLNTESGQYTDHGLWRFLRDVGVLTRTNVGIVTTGPQTGFTV